MPNIIKDLNQQLPEYVVGYIKNPRETFNCELKPWINPELNDYDRVKIAKACLALRNKGGGLLLIGVKDNGQLDDLPAGYNPESLFTQDKIQAIISAYSTQLFEIDVHLVRLSEPQSCKVLAIIVPGGITTPTMCKQDSSPDKFPKVSKGIIYTRTLGSNGTVSSAPASQQDLDDITKTCFDNRTTDIGFFLRTHLTDNNLRVLGEVVRNQSLNHAQNQYDEMEEFANESLEAFKTPSASLKEEG